MKKSFIRRWKKGLVFCLIMSLFLGGINLNLWAEDEEDICREALAKCMIDFQYSMHVSSVYCVIGYAFCVKYIKKN